VAAAVDGAGAGAVNVSPKLRIAKNAATVPATISE
jgi:hypothetical protein